jgi:pimeloyl-ACP methyl ester carboxylesterase
MLDAMSDITAETSLIAEHPSVDPNSVERVVRVDDVDMRVVENGAPDAPALLLLSNAAAPAAMWDPVVPLLAAAHRVIRVDLLGGGSSTGSGGVYNVPTWARRVGAALDRLGVTRVTAIGHSSGCMLVTSLAEQRPDRVVALALIDMGPDLNAKLPESLLFRLLLAPGTGRLLWRLRTENSIRKAARSGVARPVDIPDTFVEHAQRLTLKDFVGAMRAATDFLAERSLPDRLTPLGLPLLVIFGADDGRWRSSSAAAYRVVPGARVELLPGVGHTPMMEDPQITGKLLLDFCTGHAPAARAPTVAGLPISSRGPACA